MKLKRRKKLMSKVSFSKQQELAINAKDSNFLISAGAGSGKTAVLTERIYRLAKEKGTLDNFLVLTFTNLAAGEMKLRVRKKLEEDHETRYLATEVDNSHIETFDSFSQFVVRKHFYRIGVCQDFNIVDKSILEIESSKIIDQIFERLYETRDVDFVDTVTSYCVKNDTVLKDFVKKLLDTGNKKSDSLSYFKHLKEDFYSESAISDFIDIFYKELKDNLRIAKNAALQLEDQDVDGYNFLRAIEILEGARSYDEFYNLAKTKEASCPTRKGDGTDRAFRDALKDFYNEHVLFRKVDFGNSKQIKEEYLKLRRFAYKLIDIAIEVEKNLDQFKKEHNAYTFGDISRFLLTLLKDDEVIEELRNQFDFIMVDEYQDTNDVQELVINAIGKDNIYMVGDVKQSIYRFRGAEPSIFQDKYNEYKKGNGGKEIDLNTSYRSRKEVVDFINDIFQELMNKDNNPIDYINGHIFEYGQTKYLENKPDISYQPEIYTYEYEKSEQATLKEIELIINDINSKYNSGFQVYDFDLKKHRSCKFKDFAIIIDRSTNFGKFRKAFTEANIPLKVYSGEELFKSDVLYVVKSLVKMLRNALNSTYDVEYKHAFFSVARSFLFEYDDTKLYELNKDNKYLTDVVAQKIELLKEKMRYASIKEVMITLFEEFKIYENIYKIGEYYSNVHKLESVISLAENMDVLSYTINDFADYIIDVDKKDLGMEYKDNDSQEDSVTLITIHGSKGLEYPIIYYPGLTKEFNRDEAKSSFMLSDHYGIVLPILNEGLSSIINHLVKKEIVELDYEEKLRLFYVALTRAKEKAIILDRKYEEKKPLFVQKEARSFSSLLSSLNPEIYGKYLANDMKFDVKPIQNSAKEEYQKLVLDEINVPSNVILRNRASKEIDEEVDFKLLDFGTLVHYYLETMDLEKDDLSYIKSKKIRKYVENVKDSELFFDVTNEMVRHEFPFVDDVNHVTGYIDCLILKDDEVDIIDFKLKHIDDEKYDKQLRTYKKYVSRFATKPVKMYLLAAATGEVREVLDE